MQLNNTIHLWVTSKYTTLQNTVCMPLCLKESNFSEDNRKSVPPSHSASKRFDHAHAGQNVSTHSPTPRMQACIISNQHYINIWTWWNSHSTLTTVTYTLMYILPQLARPTSATAHWLTRLSALSPSTHHPSIPLLLYCYSLFIIYSFTLTISTCTYYLNQPD